MSSVERTLGGWIWEPGSGIHSPPHCDLPQGCDPLPVKGRCLCVCVLSCVCLFATPETVAHQAPLSMEFPRQEYQSGLPFPPPGIFPTKDWTQVSCVFCSDRNILYHWKGSPIIEEALIKSHFSTYILIDEFWFIMSFRIYHYLFFYSPNILLPVCFFANEFC